MHSFLKSRWLTSCGAVFALISVSCGPASAEKFELVYRATLNEGPGFIGQPFSDNTPLTITAEFDTSSADQWNTGAYIYTALSPTFLIGATDETYEGEPGALLILLSDPSWATFGGPAPYSAGFLPFLSEAEASILSSMPQRPLSRRAIPRRPRFTTTSTISVSLDRSR
jgi:hypothetical protein